mgnify:CR=1 FL=1
MVFYKSVHAYYQLTKPGVTYGNVLTVIAGYLLAAAGNVHWDSFFATTVGMTLVIASACSFNNYLDQDIDQIMARTKKRPSVSGLLPDWGMILFSSILLSIGMIVLWLWTNLLTVVFAALGFIVYVWLYGALSKRRSIHGTLVGSISGAIPIAAGYVAARGHIDSGLLIAFLILFFWQFPEFFSIAIYRRKEYAAAKIPVLPVVKGVPYTIIRIYVYTILFVVSSIALTFAGYTKWVYFIVMLILGSRWVWLAHRGLALKNAKHYDAWARKMFKFSIVVILVLCVMLSIGPILP